MIGVKTIWGLLRQTISEFSGDNVTTLSAALAYYAIFSIGPLLLIVVSIAGLVFGEQAIRTELEAQLRNLMGAQATQTISSMMVNHSKSTSIITTVIGAVVLISGASGVFGQLQSSLNAIWKVEPKPGRGIVGFLHDRFFSWAMVLGVGFLLLVSMIISAALAASSARLGQMLGVPEWTMHAVDFVFSGIVIAGLFAMIFKFIPDVHVPWGNVAAGALGTSLLFSLGKFLLALYLGRTSTTSAYGAAGSVVIVLLWVYYASVILFFGAEFTQVYTKRAGVPVTPTENARPVAQGGGALQAIPPQNRA